MAMNPAGLRRNLKNIVHNYSDAQVKVREATSNDPWGPSSTLMGEIADLTYNVVAFSEIMQMIWKRLNDHGKNWRHVYKALVLLEYLIKTGTEKVAQQCKENIFAIQTLKDFQYIEENKDQGMNVREKAKALVSLLRDDERFKNERARALKAKERFAQATAGVNSDIGCISHSDYVSESMASGSSQVESHLSGDLESARPQTIGEEELQLQLALAMSKEEADQEEQKRKSDDFRLQMAITQSQEDFKTTDNGPPSSSLMDTLSISSPTNKSNAEGATVATDPWGMPFKADSKAKTSWLSANNRAASTPPIPSDPWTPKETWRSETPIAGMGLSDFNKQPEDISLAAGNQHNAQAIASPLRSVDPWGVPVSQTNTTINQGGSFGSAPLLATNGDVGKFQTPSSHASPIQSTGDMGWLGETSPNPFEYNVPQDPKVTMSRVPLKRTPESFLGENSGLVNLDALVSSKPPEQMSGLMNPFQTTVLNPFQLQQQQQNNQRPSINELRSQHFDVRSDISNTAPKFSMVPPSSLGPNGSTSTSNPFLEA